MLLQAKYLNNYLAWLKFLQLSKVSINILYVDGKLKYINCKGFLGDMFK